MSVYYTRQMLRDIAANVVKKYETRDPFNLCEASGIHIYRRADFGKILGMYSNRQRRRCVFINDRLSDENKVMPCGHEFSHDTLHRDLAKDFDFTDVNFFVRNRTEYEANLLFAHIQLDTETILELAAEGYDLNQIVSIMNTLDELMQIKLEDMNQCGLPVRALYIPQMDFWKRIELLK